MRMPGRGALGAPRFVNVRARTLADACEKAARLEGRPALAASWTPCRHEVAVFEAVGGAGFCVRCGADVVRDADGRHEEPGGADTTLFTPEPPEAA